jgi:hypothetical protein
MLAGIKEMAVDLPGNATTEEMAMAAIANWKRILVRKTEKGR